VCVISVRMLIISEHFWYYNIHSCYFFSFENFGEEKVFLNDFCVNAINDLLFRRKNISIENVAIRMIYGARQCKSSHPFKLLNILPASEDIKLSRLKEVTFTKHTAS
jgi:hypothetical protein